MPAPSLTQITDFVAAYGPKLYMYKDEQYPITNVDWFLQNATIKMKDGTSQPTTDPLPTSGYEYINAMPTPALKAGGGSPTGYLNVVHPAPETQFAGQDYARFQFWFFYAYNGAGTVDIDTFLFDRKIFVPPSGEHGGDWEHLSIYADTSDSRLAPADITDTKYGNVFLAQHSGGAWKNYDGLTKDPSTGRAVVYASNNGHATYSDIGDNKTYDVLLNITSTSDTYLDTALDNTLIAANFLDQPPAPKPWMAYAGHWGPVLTYTADDLKNAVDAIVKGQDVGTVTKLLDEVLTLSIQTLQNEVSEFKGQSGPPGPNHHSEFEGPETT